MAYFEHTYDESGTTEITRTLMVQNAEGRKLDMAYWVTSWQFFLGWLDNRHLALQLPQYPAGVLVVLNPFTAEWKVVNPGLPGVSQNAWWGWIRSVFYNAPVTRVVYRPAVKEEYGESLGDWQLRDFRESKTLWTGHTSHSNYPAWSPDGNRFAIQIEEEEWGSRERVPSLLLIDASGNAQTIFKGKGISPNQFSWSPDGKYLMAWIDFTGQGQGSLSLVDAQQQTLTDLCIEVEDFYYSPPVWSPDGQFAAVAIDQAGGDWYSDTILVDIAAQKAYRFREDASPIEWMAKP